MEAHSAAFRRSGQYNERAQRMMTRLRALPKMGPAAKIGLVVTGYVITLLVAMAVVAVYVYLTDSPDRDLSSGMHAFGDSLLFLTVLTLASIPATGAALYFLRPHRAFWIAVSVASLAYAATAIPAVFDHFTLRAGRTVAAVVGPAVTSAGTRTVPGLRVFPCRALRA